MTALRIYEPGECGTDGYPFAWHAPDDGWDLPIKDQVRADAGHRCVRCDHPYEAGMGEWSPCDTDCRHGGPVRIWRDDPPPDLHADATASEIARLGAGRRVQAQWRILTVHHMTGEKADCRWWNLAALCQRCHLAIQGKVQMARVWPWPHTDWFRPYAAGWYAWTYLREEITRAEAVERMDELLALEAA